MAQQATQSLTLAHSYNRTTPKLKTYFSEDRHFRIISRMQLSDLGSTMATPFESYLRIPHQY